jgi:peptidoglycan/xylan/chitin deacetylase (PgdA/CDA1 family)
MRVSWFAIAGADALSAELSAVATAQAEAYEKAVANSSDGGSYGDPAPAAGAPEASATSAAAAAGSTAAGSATAGSATTGSMTSGSTTPGVGTPGPLPTPAGPQLDLTTHLVAVAPDVIGVRISMYQAMAPDTQLTYRTVWTDGTALLGSDALFTDDAARAAFAEAVRGRLTEAGLDAAAVAALQPAQADTAVAFDADGGAVAELSAGVVPGMGSLSVTIPEKTVTPLLSAFGAKAQAASRTPGTFPAGVSLPPPPAAGTPDCSVQKCVALTYDDGPVPDSLRLLDVLAEKQAPATLFVAGYMIKAHHSVLEAEVAAGQDIGGHTMTHAMLTKVSAEKLEVEVGGVADLITQATGRPTTLFRPSYGAFNSAVTASIGAHGMTSVLWDVDTRDWATKNADSTVAAVEAKVQPGSILLMHDLQPSSVDAAPRVIDLLRERGYTLVTVSQLLAGTRPQAGQVVGYQPGSFASQERTG